MVNNKINVNVIDGLQPILDKVVDYDNITNCITEIPQDIKLELNSGTLTLKAGSKVYVPNGKNTDGSLKFDEIVSEKDLSSNSSWTSGQVIMIPQKGLNYGIYSSQIYNHYSGSTEPTTKYDGTIWYDTTNNLIKRYNGSNSEWESGLPFPFCISTMTSGVGLTSIDQVFNGFGYIGSTVFILPGVKGLISDGWNADGTYNNMVSQLKSVYTSTFTDTNSTRALCLMFGNVGGYASGGMEEVDILPTSPVGMRRYYLKSKNEWFWWQNGVWTVDHLVKVADIVTESGVIKSLKPQLPFRAVDQNDFNKLDEEAVKTSGNQTINGTKTVKHQVAFLNEGAIYASSSTAGARDNRFRCKFYQYGLSDKVYPTNTVFSGIHHYDKNNFEYGTIFSSMSSTGTVQTNLWVRTPNGTAATMGIQQDANGNTSTYAPTPATNSNGTNIATTAWVNNKHQVVTALPSSPATGVFYFIKE